MRIGDLIKVKRVEKGLSQAKLADLLGVTQRIVSYWESHKNDPSDQYIPKLSEILNIPLEDLTSSPELFRKEEKKEENQVIQLIDLLHKSGAIKSDDIDEHTKEVIINSIKGYLKEKESRD